MPSPSSLPSRLCSYSHLETRISKLIAYPPLQLSLTFPFSAPTHPPPAQSTHSPIAPSPAAPPLSRPSRRGPSHDPSHSDAAAHAAAARAPHRAVRAHAPVPASPLYPAKSPNLPHAPRQTPPPPENSTHPSPYP